MEDEDETHSECSTGSSSSSDSSRQSIICVDPISEPEGYVPCQTKLTLTNDSASGISDTSPSTDRPERSCIRHSRKACLASPQKDINERRARTKSGGEVQYFPLLESGNLSSSCNTVSTNNGIRVRVLSQPKGSIPCQPVQTLMALDNSPADGFSDACSCAHSLDSSCPIHCHKAYPATPTSQVKRSRKDTHSGTKVQRSALSGGEFCHGPHSIHSRANTGVAHEGFEPDAKKSNMAGVVEHPLICDKLGSARPDFGITVLYKEDKRCFPESDHKSHIEGQMRKCSTGDGNDKWTVYSKPTQICLGLHSEPPWSDGAAVHDDPTKPAPTDSCYRAGHHLSRNGAASRGRRGWIQPQQDKAHNSKVTSSSPARPVRPGDSVQQFPTFMNRSACLKGSTQPAPVDSTYPREHCCGYQSDDERMPLLAVRGKSTSNSVPVATSKTKRKRSATEHQRDTVQVWACREHSGEMQCPCSAPVGRDVSISKPSVMYTARQTNLLVSSKGPHLAPRHVKTSAGEGRRRHTSPTPGRKKDRCLPVTHTHTHSNGTQRLPLCPFEIMPFLIYCVYPLEAVF